MKEKPRLLHICSYSWETGGPASFIYNHSQFQIEKGVQVDIASAVYDWQKPYDVPQGVNLYEFPKSVFSKLISEFSWPLIFWFIKNRNKYDVIHLHGLWHFGSILPFIIPSRAKKVITIHGFLDTYAMKRSGMLKKIFWIFFQKRFLSKSDKLHAMNDEEYQYLISLFPHKKDTIRLIGNGIEDPLKINYSKPNPKFVQQIEQFIDGAGDVYLFLSRKSAKKGIDILLTAFAEMSQTSHWNARLILAGPEDDFSPTIKQFFGGYQGNDILEIPLVSGAEKDYLYKNCTVVVLPSYSEGFSIAALEAMAYGKCSILSTKVGFAKDLKNTNAAILIEPTQKELLQAFHTIHLNNKYCDLLKLNARNLYLDKFQSLDISNKLYEFLFM